MTNPYAVQHPSGRKQTIRKPGRFQFKLLNTDKHVHADAEKDSQYHRPYSVSDYIERVLAISSFEELYSFATKLKRDCGFSITGGGLGHKALHEPSTAYFYYSAADTGWSLHYGKHLMVNDPMVHYCHNNVLPLVLNTKKDFNLIRKLNPMMADAVMDFGITGFVTLPTHGLNTSISGFRFVSTRDDRLTLSDIQQHLPLLSIMSTYMHEALARLTTPCSDTMKAELSPREKEVLRRVASGLNTWEISENLHISENTVLTHMKSVHTKLGVKTRQHAVAKALSLNLI